MEDDEEVGCTIQKCLDFENGVDSFRKYIFLNITT